MRRAMRAAPECLRSGYVEKRLDIDIMSTNITLQNLIADLEWKKEVAGVGAFRNMTEK